MVGSLSLDLHISVYIDEIINAKSFLHNICLIIVANANLICQKSCSVILTCQSRAQLERKAELSFVSRTAAITDWKLCSPGVNVLPR